MRFVPAMDTTGLVAFEKILEELKRRKCRLILSGLQPDVWKLLDQSGLLLKIGPDNCFATTDAAIRTLSEQLLAESTLSVIK
jgi:SulP family sulfate permease